MGVSTFLYAQESKTVYFDFAKELPNVASRIELNDWIASHKNAEILKIGGYCDSVDTNLFNKKLANARIQSVLNSLKFHGISFSNNLELNIVGEDFEQSNLQAENRKVIFEYIEVSEPIVEPEIQILETLQQKIEKERISLFDKFESAAIGDKIVIYNIHFEFNSDEIIPESKDLFEQLLMIMELNTHLEIRVLGHICCNPDPNDTKLSTKRALKIYNYLKENGIPKSRLEYKGLGSTQSIFSLPEKNEEERVANRRVEIQILKK